MTQELSFPFPAPERFGEPQQVAEGVYWLRMPLPFALDHINLWLLDEGDGWTIVDTGVATDAVIDHWLALFEHWMADQPVQRVIVTHLHPDHVGLAGWICSRWRVELWMSRTDYLLCRNLLADSHREPPDEAIRFYRAAGFDEKDLNTYRAHFGGFGRLVRALPNAYRRLMDNETLTIGGHEWRVLMGQGHAPEHACLYCLDKNVFIAGDQLLPGISSNVSVWPYEPHADPLSEWIRSCQRLSDFLPPDVLVLPAHEQPFRGAQQRLQALIDSHEESLAKLYDFCATPKRVVDVFPALFRRPINKHNLILAAGESIAHLNCLLGRGQLHVETDSDGVDYYRQVISEHSKEPSPNRNHT